MFLKAHDVKNDSKGHKSLKKQVKANQYLTWMLSLKKEIQERFRGESNKMMHCRGEWRGVVQAERRKQQSTTNVVKPGDPVRGVGSG